MMRSGREGTGPDMEGRGIGSASEGPTTVPEPASSECPKRYRSSLYTVSES
jgi:hypothetical protein